jgi:hypothetical protein
MIAMADGSLVGLIVALWAAVGLFCWFVTHPMEDQ